jgi:pimeloyl-ACP methyl ester carboxylesterase
MNKHYLKWGGVLGVTILLLILSACEQPTAFQSESEMLSLHQKSFLSGNQVVVLVHGFQGGGALGGSGSGSNGNTNPGFSAEMGITQLKLDENGQIIEKDLMQPYFLDENDEGLPIWLYDLGYDVWFAHYTTGPDVTDSLDESAMNLSVQINQVKDLDSDGKVVLIAASLGGLVSRYYLENTELYANNVEAIFTLGTPHKGMPVGMLLDSVL